MTEKTLVEVPEITLGDMNTEDFRNYGHKIIDWIADYFSNIEQYPVLSQVKPGDIKNNLPKLPPDKSEQMDEILDDINKIILPGITHWNHPAFNAYFAVSASGPGILGELLCSAFNINGMLWKTSPSATELEEVALGWLRGMLGLSEKFFGIIYDTASISVLHAIAAAREKLNLQIREEGMSGREELPKLRVYCSQETHSSIEKAAILLGIGQSNVVKIPVDNEFKMNAEALSHAIEKDLDAEFIPCCVIATVGTTSSTSIDPLSSISDICRKYDIWLHVDGAYGGSALILPEMKELVTEINKADSFVLNPHKWLFTPIDLSVFYCKHQKILKKAFSLIPEYLVTNDINEVINYMDYGIQLGRRFRALKLWMIIRYFGKDGLIARIREHIRLAKLFASWIDLNPDFERLAQVHFSVVCFRACPIEIKEKLNSANQNEKSKIENYLDKLNAEIINSINSSGRIYISHTKLNEKYTIRYAIGNIRTNEKHIKAAWELIQQYTKEIYERINKS